MLGVFESGSNDWPALGYVLVVPSILGRPFNISHTLSGCHGLERRQTLRYDVGCERSWRGQGGKGRRGRHVSRLRHSTRQGTRVRHHTPSHVGCTCSPPTTAVLHLSCSSVSALRQKVEADVSFPLPRFPRPSPRSLQVQVSVFHFANGVRGVSRLKHRRHGAIPKGTLFCH